MKWTTQGLQMDELCRLQFDTVDVTILRYIIDFFSTNKMYMKVVDDKIYFWINYQTILNDLPILRINNRRTLARRFDNYVEKGLMHKLEVRGNDEYLYSGKKRKRSGSFIYFHINAVNLEKLLGGVLQSTGGPDAEVQGDGTQEYEGDVPESTIKDSSFKDSSCIDSSVIDSSNNIPPAYYDKLIFGDTSYYFYKNPDTVYICKNGREGQTKYPIEIFNIFKKYNGHPVLDKLSLIYSL